MKPTKFRKNTDDYNSIHEIFDDKVYDPKWFGIENNSIKTIIDVGGLIGSYTLWAFENYPNANIFTYEPNPDSYDFLLQNVETLRKTNRIKPYNLAVWDKNCEMKLHRSTKKNTGGSSIIYKPEWFPNVESLPSIEVSVISINEVLNSTGNIIDILKLDCEGAEYDILYSLDSEKLKSIKHIVMEYHNPNLESTKVKELMEYLRNQGFLVQKSLGNNKLGYIYAKQIDMNLDIVNDLIDDIIGIHEKRYIELQNRKIVKIVLKLANIFNIHQ